MDKQNESSSAAQVKSSLAAEVEAEVEAEMEARREVEETSQSEAASQSEADNTQVFQVRSSPRQSTPSTQCSSSAVTEAVVDKQNSKQLVLELQAQLTLQKEEAATLQAALRKKEELLKAEVAAFETERANFKESLRSKVVKNVELTAELSEERQTFHREMEKQKVEMQEAMDKRDDMLQDQVRRCVNQAEREKDEALAAKQTAFEKQQESLKKQLEDVQKTLGSKDDDIETLTESLQKFQRQDSSGIDTARSLQQGQDLLDLQKEHLHNEETWRRQTVQMEAQVAVLEQEARQKESAFEQQRLELAAVKDTPVPNEELDVYKLKLEQAEREHQEQDRRLIERHQQNEALQKRLVTLESNSQEEFWQEQNKELKKKVAALEQQACDDALKNKVADLEKELHEKELAWALALAKNDEEQTDYSDELQVLQAQIEALEGKANTSLDTLKELQERRGVRGKEMKGQIAVGFQGEDAKEQRKRTEASKDMAAAIAKPLKSAEPDAESADRERFPMQKRNFSLSVLPEVPDLLDEGVGEWPDEEEQEAAVGSSATAFKRQPSNEPKMQRFASISCMELVAEPEEKEMSRQQARRAKPTYQPHEKDIPVIIVASELAPFSKTGGLAMVTASFGYEFAARGRRTMAISPMYKNYEGVVCIGEKDIWMDSKYNKVRYMHKYDHGCDYIFVDHECYKIPEGGGIYCQDNRTGKEYENNVFRFALLSLAALEAPLVLHIRGQKPWGQRVLFVANDWQAGLVPVYLTHKFRKHDTFKDARCLYVIHNMGYQGRYPLNKHNPEVLLGLEEAASNDIRYGDCINLSKGGIVTCDRVITVSPNYAKEIQVESGGFGLHEVVKASKFACVGILNGIDDSWDPRTDTHILTNYDENNINEIKPRCKAELQKALGLEVDVNRPLVGFVGRLTHQKGIDLLVGAIPWLMEDTGNGVTGRAQLVMMGEGDGDCLDMLKNAEKKNPGGVCGYCGFCPIVEHKLMAGCDFLIMPSRYEPCGLPQMYCQAYGTLPLVHGTGGLKDSVKDDGGPHENTGYTFLFDPNDIKRCLYAALETYIKRPHEFKQMQQNAMAKDFYWPQAIDEYERQMDVVLGTAAARP